MFDYRVSTRSHAVGTKASITAEDQGTNLTPAIKLCSFGGPQVDWRETPESVAEVVCAEKQGATGTGDV